MRKTARSQRVWIGAVCAALALSTAAPAVGVETHRGSRTMAVIDWNATMGKAAVAACIAPFDNPLHESRMYAMAHLAIHDALNAIDRRYAPYATRTSAPRSADPDAAVARAARDVLVPTIRAIPAPFPDACRDAGVAVVEDAYAGALAAIPSESRRDAGLAAGAAAARRILAMRVGDGSDTPLIVGDFPQGTTPGAWRFTADRPFAFAPGWGSVRPFAVRRPVDVPAPLALTSARYARDVNELKSVGRIDSTSRTADQTELARFWEESSPLAWNRIARTVSRGRLDTWEQARMFAQLNAALADGYISTFATKYSDLFWRPETAIRLADTDGNPNTSADPSWSPLRTTPAIPDHDSAHSVQGAAAATVIALALRTDRVSFGNCTNSIAEATCASDSPVVRRFSSLSQAARENAESRIYIGFHFRYSTQVGLVHGAVIGATIRATLLKPVR